jgi:single-strand DNA-binding protein
VNEIYVTVAGRLVADPETRSTRSGGIPFAAFRVASTVRRVNRGTGEFEDAGTSYVSVTAFRSLGANVAHSLRKGDPVVVHGRMRVNQWLRSDETLATSVEVDAYSVGHDLSYGTTTFAKVSRAQVDRSDRMSDDAVQEAHATFEAVDPETGEYLVHEGGLDGAGAGEDQPAGQLATA